jgi:hypothetical protein
MVCNSKTIVCIRKNAVCLNHRIRPNAEPCWMEAQSCSSGNRGGGPHSKTAIGNARLLRMALYRRRLWGRLRRGPPRPVVGETAMTSHAVWPAIRWQRMSFGYSAGSPQKKFPTRRPATGLTKVRSTQAHSGIECPECAQLRPTRVRRGAEHHY